MYDMTPNVFSLPLWSFISPLVSPLLFPSYLFNLYSVHISTAILILFLSVHVQQLCWKVFMLESFHEVGYENTFLFFL